ncbi:hypothetical protein [Caldalkalibacillus mannanilyticus]|uniref:hypothetical protein n=1 Tax=Caldalkalibacillus mannanilyticus TaxID=1418 RepID=UPI0004683D2B|nr:hypothetical protein [Caldalkalibacillus mannanilyticus]
MKKRISSCLIFVLLTLMSLAVPLSGSIDHASTEGTSQFISQQQTIWLLSEQETRFTFSPRLRMSGNEALRYSDPFLLSFTRSVGLHTIDIQISNYREVLKYKEGLATYSEIKESLASSTFLTPRKRMERSWVRPFSLV